MFDRKKIPRKHTEGGPLESHEPDHPFSEEDRKPPLPEDQETHDTHNNG